MKTLYDAAQSMISLALKECETAKKEYQLEIDNINADFKDGILNIDTYYEMLNQSRIKYYCHLEVAIEHIKKEWEG